MKLHNSLSKTLSRLKLLRYIQDLASTFLFAAQEKWRLCTTDDCLECWTAAFATLQPAAQQAAANLQNCRTQLEIIDIDNRICWSQYKAEARGGPPSSQQQSYLMSSLMRGSHPAPGAADWSCSEPATRPARSLQSTQSARPADLAAAAVPATPRRSCCVGDNWCTAAKQPSHEDATASGARSKHRSHSIRPSAVLHRWIG